jgi:broad specificity phosphatase PhoE
MTRFLMIRHAATAFVGRRIASRYDIDSASVSIVELYEDGPKIRCVNSTEAILG